MISLHAPAMVLCETLLILRQRDNILHFEQSLPPIDQVRRIRHNLHITEVTLSRSAILHGNWSQVDLVLQPTQGFMVSLGLMWQLRVWSKDAKLSSLAIPPKVIVDLFWPPYVGREFLKSRRLNGRSLIKSNVMWQLDVRLVV